MTRHRCGDVWRTCLGVAVLSACAARSNASAFRYLGECAVPGSARSVVVRDTLAYVASDSGLTVLSVATPEEPRVVGFAGVEGTGYALAVEGTRAYVAGKGSCLGTVDISDPYEPSALGTSGSDCHFVWGVDCRAEQVGTGGLVATASNCAVDLFAPSESSVPAPVSRVVPFGWGWCTAAWILPADSAYFPVYKWGYHKVDDVVFRGSELFALYFEGNSNGPVLRLRRYDIAQSSAPRATDSLFLLYGGCALAVDDTCVYVAHLGGYRTFELGGLTGAGLDIVSAGNGPMALLGSVIFPGSGEDIVVRGDTALVACGAGGVAAIDCSDKAAPVLVDTVRTADGLTVKALGLNESGGLVCVADQSRGLLVFDRYAGQTSLPGRAPTGRAMVPRKRASVTLYTLTGRRASPNLVGVGIAAVQGRTVLRMHVDTR